MKSTETGTIVATMSLAVLTAAWLTSIVTCIKTSAWLLLLAVAMFFPIGILHGVLVWFGVA